MDRSNPEEIFCLNLNSLSLPMTILFRSMYLSCQLVLYFCDNYAHTINPCTYLFGKVDSSVNKYLSWKDRDLSWDAYYPRQNVYAMSWTSDSSSMETQIGSFLGCTENTNVLISQDCSLLCWWTFPFLSNVKLKRCS